MASSQSPFSLRPWPTGDKKPKTLGEFIKRVRSGPGDFRSISEDDLRREVELEKTSAATASASATTPAAAPLDVDMVSESEDGDVVPTVTTTIETIRAAREEAVRSIDTAHQNAMLTLDFISLLLTKEDPTHAGRTLSPALRERVGIGTMGADKLAAPKTSEAMMQEKKMVATGWKFTDASRSMDSVLSAAARLQREIALETRYWAEVLAVSENGWSVSRLPYERQTMGVKFGFSESAAEFRRNNLAPMRRSDDGSVHLAAAKVSTPQRVLVTVERDGEVVGRSMMPRPLTPDSSLEARVMEARNTIFNQELWHEINREGRTLLSYNVRLEGTTVTYSRDDDGWGRSQIVFRLVDLSDEALHEDGWGSGEEDVFAESLSSALHLLLSYAHRQNLRIRSRPGPPHLRQSRAGLAYSLLRPVIAYLEHEAAMEKLGRFMSGITAMLQSAGHTAAFYTLIEPPLDSFAAAAMAAAAAGAAASGRLSHPTASEALLASFLGPREFQLELTITPNARLTVTGRTAPHPFPSTQYFIRLLPPLSPDYYDNDDSQHQQQQQQQQAPSSSLADNPLRSLFPPTDWYPNLREVSYYIRQAVPRILADEAEQFAFALAAQHELGSRLRVDFVKSVSGTAISGVEPDKREVRFEICSAAGGGDAADEGCGGDGQLVTENDAAAAARLDIDVPTELRVYGVWPVGDDDDGDAMIGVGLVRKRWTWTIDEAVEGVPKENLAEVYASVLRGDAVP